MLDLLLKMNVGLINLKLNTNFNAFAAVKYLLKNEVQSSICLGWPPYPSLGKSAFELLGIKLKMDDSVLVLHIILATFTPKFATLIRLLP